MKRFLIVVALVLAVGSPAAAQDEGTSTRDLFAAMSPDEVGKRASALLAGIRGDIDAIDDCNEQLVAASREDSLVLQLQVFSLSEEVLNNVHELVDALMELEAGGAQAELRDRVTTACDRITPLVWRSIDDLTADVDALRARRQDIAASERPALEDQVSRTSDRLDTVFALTGVHLQKMATLGQDTAAVRATYADRIEARAKALVARLQLDLVRADELAQRLRKTPGDADAAAVSIAVKKSIDRDTASLEKMLGLMEAAGLDTRHQREQLVTITRDFSSGLLNAKVTASLIQRSWKQLTAWLTESGPPLLFKLLLLLAILFAGRIVARVVRRAVEKGLAKGNVNLSQLLRHMIVQSSYNAVMALALMMGLSQLGISLGPLLAGFGVVGFILGFAMQDSLSNLAAGMMILINRPYDVGDLVDVAGAFGKVETMSLVSTGILTLDNQKLVVPNSKIWGDIIKNVTDQNVRRVDMTFGISYSDDIPKAEKVLEEILTGNERVLEDPPPVVRLHNLGDSSVDFIVRPWVRTEDYWEVFWETTRAVKMRFDEEGVSIPFPQRDVHIFEEKLASREPAAPSGPVEPVESTDWTAETAPEQDSDD